MMQKLKAWFAQIRCKHIRSELNRWHVCHGPNGNDPAEIEAEYICSRCGKIIYSYWPIIYKETFERCCPQYDVFFIDIYLRSGAKLTVTEVCENPHNVPDALFRDRYIENCDWIFSEKGENSEVKESIRFGPTRIRTSEIIAMNARPYF